MAVVSLAADGFAMAFFQDCSEIKKPNDLRDFHKLEKLSGAYIPTSSSLFLKKTGAIRIQDFRAISLISAPHKIISKVCNRIRGVIQDAVDGNQFAFIKGRQILDCVLIADESLEDYKSRKQKGVVIKIDLERAYDKTDCDYCILDYVIAKGLAWRSWVFGFFVLLTYRLFQTEPQKDSFQQQRGSGKAIPYHPFCSS